MSGPENLVQYYCPNPRCGLVYNKPGNRLCNGCSSELGRRSRMESHEKESLRKLEAYEADQRPAPQGAIERLQELEITDDMLEKHNECVICEQKFELGSMVKAMNCGHFFHGRCIVERLQSINSCPICGCSMFQSFPAKKWWGSSSGSSSRA